MYEYMRMRTVRKKATFIFHLNLQLGTHSVRTRDCDKMRVKLPT